MTRGFSRRETFIHKQLKKKGFSCLPVNDLIFSFSWLLKSLESSVTRSATVFLVRPILAKAGRFSGHTTSAAYMHTCFYKHSIREWLGCLRQFVGNNVAGFYSPITNITAVCKSKEDCCFFRPATNLFILSFLICPFKWSYFSLWWVSLWRRILNSLDTISCWLPGLGRLLFKSNLLRLQVTH